MITSCTVQDCTKPRRYTDGLCSMHHLRLKRNGQLDLTSRPTSPGYERFMSKVEVTPGGCWVWTGWKTPNGYGMFQANGKALRAHRWIYEHAHGKIPDGLMIDHLCHDPNACALGYDCPHRSCVNPDHLEAVSPAENMRRMRRTLCKYGHEMTVANTYVRSGKPGQRWCRECRARRVRERRERLRRR